MLVYVMVNAQECLTVRQPNLLRRRPALLMSGTSRKVSQVTGHEKMHYLGLMDLEMFGLP